MSDLLKILCRMCKYTVCIAVIILFCKGFVLPQKNSSRQSYTAITYRNGFIYSAYYGFGANSRVYWTVDENILGTTNYWTQIPSTTCLPQVPCNQDDPYHISFSLSRYCDGDGHRLSMRIADDHNQETNDWYFSAGFDGSFTCTGGSDVPPPTQIPLIVVPGIMGSVIKGPYQGETVQYWTNFALTDDPNVTSVRNLTLDSSSPYYRTGLFASDILRNVSIYNRPVAPVYEPLLNNLSTIGYNRPYNVARHFEQSLGCDYSLKNPDTTQVPNLFVFPYDWRQDNTQTITKLGNYIRCIQQLYPPGTKVNIIAHSMGGLMLRRYLLYCFYNHLPTRLNKVITIASPFLGAPEATYQIYTGGSFKGVYSMAVVSQGSIQFLAPFLPSLHQLLPSRKYHELRRGVIFETGDADGNGIPDETYDFGRVVLQLNTAFPTTSPGTVGAGFHDYTGQDDWHNEYSYATENVKYFHILGKQNQLDTTDALYVSKSIRCRLSGNRFTGCFENKLYTPIKGIGDGTVPVISTAMGWAGLPDNQTADLAPPGMRVFVRRSISSDTDEKAEHRGMTGDEKVRDLISYFLGIGQQPAQTDELFELSRPTSAKAIAVPEDSPTYDPSYYLTIVGKSEVTVRDETGNTAAVENGFLRNDVKGLNDYEMIGDQSVMLTFSTGHNYAVVFRTGNLPMGIELINGRGNSNPTSAVRYNDLNLPVNTNVQLTFSQTGATELKIDADNNGTFETTIAPTANLSGASARDVKPPTININAAAGQNNTATVSITAEDFESGVSKVWYSLDGQAFDQYTAPVTITLSSNPVTIKAFADDNAANRSGLVSKTFSLTPTVIPVAECVSTEAGRYRAWFSYQNQNSAAVVISTGKDNLLLPLPADKGQITTFQTGINSRAFSVPMLKKRVDWKLRGNDGLLRTATVSIANTPICQQ